MAAEIEHEGKKYLLKTDVEDEYTLKTNVEDIVRERTQKIAERANEWEGKAKGLETQTIGLQQRATTADTLAAQVRTLQDQVQNANGRFERFLAVSQVLGVADPDVVDGLEHAHQKLLSTIPEGQQGPDFGAWLSAAKQQPQHVPSYLQHLFEGQGGQPQQSQFQQPPQQGQAQGQQQAAPLGAYGQLQQHAQRPWAPSTTGQQQAPQGVVNVTRNDIQNATTMEELQAMHQQLRQQGGQ